MHENAKHCLMCRKYKPFTDKYFDTRLCDFDTRLCDFDTCLCDAFNSGYFPYCRECISTFGQVESISRITSVVELTKSQRISDAVTWFCGTWKFIGLASLLLFIWVLLNTILAIFGKFDPYPFMLGNLVLTVFSTFQSPLIMMTQNRQIQRDQQAAEAQATLIKELLHGLHAKIDEFKAQLEKQC